MSENQPLATLSASAINDFLACPRRFALRRIHKVQPTHRASSLALGSAFHEGVRWSFIQHELKGAVDRDHVRQRFRSAFRAELRRDGPPVLFDEGEDEGKLADLGVRMLDVFLARVPMPDRLVGIEVAFSTEIFDPKTGEVLPPLIGALDAVVERGGSTMVLEIKTGKRRFAKDRLENDLQPSAYRLGAQSLGYDDAGLELVVTTKSTRPDVQIERVVRGPADDRDLAATAAGLVRAVTAGVEHPVRGWRCAQCEYAGVCL